MKKFLTLLIVLTCQLSIIDSISAQPAARRAQQKSQATQQKNTASQTLTTRAQISFPTAQQMKEDVVWRRDIYREIDLTQGTNSGLYYPVEPVGSQMNLFTYLFKLVLSGQVKAYEYRLDGNESFEADAVVKPLSLLDNYHIYYERKDGRLKIDNADIPSREVKSYYIKESSYYDQASATFHTKVIALCPIMSREDDFAASASKYPLFWVKYDDVAPFLTKQTIMTSDINNAAMMSVDDYFLKNMYKGKIYKTNNMLGQTLAQAVAQRNGNAMNPDMEMMEEGNLDSLMTIEQKRIEKELKDFEENIWGDKARKDSLDSIAKVQAAQPKEKKSLFKKSGKSSASSATVEKKQKTTKPKTSSPSNSSAARVSVRRQRH